MVTFATTGSGFDTLLAVYTGANVDQLTPVVPGVDYFVVIVNPAGFLVSSNAALTLKP